jgi:hypothetical protein
MTYVHNHLACLHPVIRCDIVDHSDILILLLYPAGDMIKLMNVYSDNHNYAICHLYEEVNSLPAFHYMGGDFNCHSEVWDGNVSHHQWAAQHLLSVANDLGLEWAHPSNHGLTHILHNSELDGSVINLVFTIPDPDGQFLPRLAHDLRGPSDHTPITSFVPTSDTDIQIKCTVLPKNSEEEKEFLGSVPLSIQLLNTEGLDLVTRIEEVSQGISDTFSLAWQKCAKEVTITSHSKPWWNQECANAIRQYWEDRPPWKWKSFCHTTHKAKRVFFDACIEEISETNWHPWDLMEWVKQHKLPACEAIQYQGQPCHTLESLWDALHRTYNAASRQQVDLSTLNDLDPLPKRDWVGFSSCKMFDALSVCSSCSAPGPDHVTWTHLKRILPDSVISGKILSLANVCLQVGYWPSHFKESVSVIIPKPGKASLLTPPQSRSGLLCC